MRTLKARIGMLLVLGLSVAPAISYVESSSGFQTPALDGGRTELEFADINDDGNVDILSIGDHGNPYINTQEHGIMVWFGDGRGNWSVYQDGDFGYGGIAVGDVNNDGKLDVGCGMHHNYAQPGQMGDSILTVGLGDGTGRNWTPWDDGLATHGEDWGMFGTDFADVNNDGWLDLISNSFGYGAGVHVYLNYQNGYWDQSYGFTGANSMEDAVFGDVNNDGNTDFAVGNQYATVCFGDGTGSFTSAHRNLPGQGNGGYTSVSLGDIDNDGGRDLALVRGDTIDVWRWNSAGDSWVNARGNLPMSGYEAVQLCVMDGDGNMDLVGLGSHAGTVWSGDGAGHWTQAASFTTPTPGYSAALRCGGDVDHNGFPDIALVDDEGTWPSDRNVAHCFKEASVPTSLQIAGMLPRGGERFYSGSVQFVDWICAVPAGDTARVLLELSVAGSGGPWTLIADTLKNSGRFQWAVPDNPSNDCRVRYIATTRHGADTAVTPRSFTILPSTGAGESPKARSGGRLRARVSPNPVQDRAVLSYELPASSWVRITLHDATGRELNVLRGGREAAGGHSLPLDLARTRSGVYFCQVQTEQGGTLQKLVVP